MATRGTTRNEPTAGDAGIDVVEAVRAWVDTYIEAEIPEGAITVAQFAATTGKSKERAQGILIGLARCGRLSQSGRARNERSKTHHAR